MGRITKLSTDLQGEIAALCVGFNSCLEKLGTEAAGRENSRTPSNVKVLGIAMAVVTG